MYTEFNEYELLELFDKEPILIHDKESGVFLYSKDDEYGFKLTTTLSIYEMICDISLSFKKFKKSIFNFQFKEVKKVEKVDDKMILTYGKENRKVSFSFYPNFAFEEI